MEGTYVGSTEFEMVLGMSTAVLDFLEAAFRPDNKLVGLASGGFALELADTFGVGAGTDGDFVVTVGFLAASLESFKEEFFNILVGPARGGAATGSFRVV